MSKKIMQINITCGVGSTGKISKTLYEATLKKGYAACFAYSAYEPMLKEAFRIETKIQNIVRRGANRILGRRQVYSSGGTKRLIKYIRAEKPDLIHIHNVQQNSVNYLMLFRFLKEEKVPVVYTLHDCWAFTGGCFHFSKIECIQYKNKCNKCNAGPFDDVGITAQEAYKKKQQYIGKNENIHVTCVSEWLSNEAKHTYMGDMAHPPQVIYNGINTNVFRPRNTSVLRKKLKISQDEFVILGVASYWNKDKGIHLLIEMIHKLPKLCKLILIGDGLENIVDFQEEQILCVNKTQNVDELAKYYSMADVFVNASEEETFGLTTAEALACGTPAIVFNSTACPEVIDEKTGICVEVGVDELVAAVWQICRNGKEYYAEACATRIREHFSESKMLNSYMNLYETILNDKCEKEFDCE